MAQTDPGTVDQIRAWLQAVLPGGALAFGAFVYRREALERRRDGVKGVRARIEWVDSAGDVVEGVRPAQTGRNSDLVGRVVVQNDGAEPVTAVSVPIWYGPYGNSGEFGYDHYPVLEPGQVRLGEPHFPITRLQELDSIGAIRWGPVVVFRDTRGHLWERTTTSVLIEHKPVRFYAPWRVGPLVLDGELPPYALRWRWLRRNRTYFEEGTRWRKAPWWMPDVRWRLWRMARTASPVPYGAFKWATRWHNRKQIAARRRDLGLPLPFWIIDERARDYLQRKSNERDMAYIRRNGGGC